MTPHKTTPETPADRNDPRFQSTRWSVVLAAQNAASPHSAAALAELCRAYWYPLYAFVRRTGLSHHEAEDMTQGFFCRLLEKDGLASVAPAKGRFRSFLLTSMKNYMTNQRDRANAIKRGGAQPPISLDMAPGPERYGREPADHRTPDSIYERSWALTLLDDVLDEVARDYRDKGKGRIFDALACFLAGTDRSDSYAGPARTLDTSVENVKVLVHRLRRRFADELRRRVADTVSSEQEIDDEIRHLIHCFSNPD